MQHQKGSDFRHGNCQNINRDDVPGDYLFKYIFSMIYFINAVAGLNELTSYEQYF